MAYTWDHALPGEDERLRLMSQLLDPTTRNTLAAVPIQPDWQCAEVGAGNGSVSTWIASKLGPGGQATAIDIDTSFMPSPTPTHFHVKKLDLTQDSLPDGAFELVTARAVLHHLPNRHQVLDGLLAAVRPGGYLLVEEPDFYPTATARPQQLADFWQDFLSWSQTRDIDYLVGRKIPVWLQRAGAEVLQSAGHTIVHNGGHPFARWWQASINEVAPVMISDGATTQDSIDQFMRFYDDQNLWTMSIAFTGTLARRTS